MAEFSKLRALGIDPEEGMAYCAEDAEFYREMLEEYVSAAGSTLAELERFFAEGNWQRYGILAHSIKSTSRTVGATAFAERARELELAAKEGRTEALRAHHAGFAAAYRALAEGVRAALD